MADESDEVESNSSYVLITLKTNLTRAEELYIPDNRFMNWEISAAVAPDAVKIGKNAFFGCAITEIDFPKVQIIEEGAFMGCTEATRINIPEAREIGVNAFAVCSGVNSIIAPEVQSIGYNAFQECSGVEEMNFPKVTSIDENAFRGCYDTIEEENADGHVTVTEVGLKRFNAPNVQSLGSGAFWGCKLLENAIFPNVFDLGNNVFNGCNGLVSIEIPEAEKMANGLFGEFNSRDRSNTLCQNLKFLNIRKMRENNFWNGMFYQMTNLKCINMFSVDYGYINQNRADLDLSPNCDVICQDGIIETLTHELNNGIGSGDSRYLEKSTAENITLPDGREVFYI